MKKVFTRLLKWVLAPLGLILITLSIGAWFGSWIFLNQQSTYTESAATLPEFTASNPQGLVQIPAGEWSFRARVAGFDNKAPKGNLILLHGFPETSIMWEPLMEKAADAGYRVVAFDQRGYSPGARPMERSAYQATQLVSDVLAVADEVGFESFHLVGHDWGSVIGWQTVFASPERIETFSALSIPHISAIIKSFEVKPELRGRSSYMAFFWLPWLPELSFSANDFSSLRELYAEHPQHHADEYLALFEEPGALTGAFNWYRGALQGLSQPEDKTKTPTLFIWGKHDTTTSDLAVELQREFMGDGFDIIELDGGHWIVETHTEQVVQAIMTHVEESG